VSAELICQKKEPLISALMMEEDLLDKLHSVLTRPPPLSPNSPSVKHACSTILALFQAKLGEVRAVPSCPNLSEFCVRW